VEQCHTGQGIDNNSGIFVVFVSAVQYQIQHYMCGFYIQEVNRQNQRISMLELQKARLQQLLSYSTSDSSYPHIYNCNHKMVSTKLNREL